MNDIFHEESKDKIVINWVLNYTCSQKCDYCFQYKNKNIMDNVSLALSKIIMKNLKKLDNNTLLLSLLGGEPTLNKNFKEILNLIKDEIYDKLCILEILTCLWSPLVKNIDEFLKILEPLKDKISIIFTFHTSEIRTLKKSKKIQDIILKLKENGYRIFSKIALYKIKENKEILDDFINFLKINNLDYSLFEPFYKDSVGGLIIKDELTKFYLSENEGKIYYNEISLNKPCLNNLYFIGLNETKIHSRCGITKNYMDIDKIKTRFNLKKKFICKHNNCIC